MSIKVWIDARSTEYRVVALTQEALYFEDMENSAAQNATDRLNEGSAPDTVFGKDATHIPLRRLNKVTIDRNDDNDVELDFSEGKEKQNATLTVHEKDTRDSIYSALREATVGRFDEFVDQYGRARAAFAALATLTFFAVLTWLLAAAALALATGEDVEITGRRRGLKQLVVGLLDLLGPWGVSIIGGFICLLTLLVLVSRIRSPQLLYILQSEPYKPSSAIATTVKYALLIAVWALVLRAMLS